MVTWRGSEYVVVAAGVAVTGTEAFGLRLDVATAFLDGMTECIVNGTIPAMFPRELPVRALDGSLEPGRRDGGAEFPDGLAYFGTQPPVSAHRDLAWYPEKGVYKA